MLKLALWKFELSKAIAFDEKARPEEAKNALTVARIVFLRVQPASELDEARREKEVILTELA